MALPDGDRGCGMLKLIVINILVVLAASIVDAAACRCFGFRQSPLPTTGKPINHQKGRSVHHHFSALSYAASERH